MSMADVFAEAEAVYKAQVMYDTWGHLDPIPGVKYPGHILFTQDNYGQDAILDVEFKNLPGGPYFYEAVGDFVDQARGLAEHGKLVLFTGYYMKFKTVESGRFVGKFQGVSLRNILLEIANNPDAKLKWPRPETTA